MMNSTLSKVLIFAAGATIGSAVTWKLLKNKFQQYADNEIEEVKARLQSRAQKDSDQLAIDFEASEEDAESDFTQYTEHANKYTSHSDKKEKEVESMNKPQVIPPEEIGENEDYDVVTLNYWADGVLTTQWGVPIHDVEGTVGKESLTHFGEYEEDAVHVLNDDRETYYEILRDNRAYADIESSFDESDEDEDEE